MTYYSCLGLPRWLSGKESACQCRRCRRYRFDPWVGKTLWRRKWQPALVFFPGKSQGQRSLEGYSLWACKESDMTEWINNNYSSLLLLIILLLPWGLSSQESACQCRSYRRLGFDSWVGKIPWRRAWLPTPVFLPGESHGQRTWQAIVHKVSKSQTWLKRLNTHTHHYCRSNSNLIITFIMVREGPSGKVTFNLKPEEWGGASCGLDQKNSLSRQWKALILERAC